jgi:hypothetical protein
VGAEIEVLVLRPSSGIEDQLPLLQAAYKRGLVEVERYTVKASNSNFNGGADMVTYVIMKAPEAPESAAQKPTFSEWLKSILPFRLT